MGVIRNESKFLSKRCRASIKQVVDRAFAGEPSKLEFWGVRSNGEAFPKEVRLYKGRYFGQDVVIALATDITERKRAEEKSRKEMEFTDSIVNSLPGIYYLFDQKGKFRRWNENLVRVGEYSVDEMLKRMPMDFFPVDEKKMIADKIKEVFEKGYAEVEGTLLTKSGKLLPYLFNGVRVTIDGEQMVSGMGVNIATRKEVEKMREEFMMIAAHELRAPLTAMKWQVSMILDGRTYGPVSDKLARPLSGMTESLCRLIGLVNDMINIGRMETGNLRLEPTAFDVRKLIFELSESFGPEAKKRGLELDTTGVGSMEVWADRDKTAQILSNLIDNAIKFTDTGKIKVITQGSAALVNILVTDTGVGIADGFQGKLFGKFAQAISKEAGRPRGTGLGLYISRQLARNMGGDVVLVESQPGKGCIFALSLPKGSKLG